MRVGHVRADGALPLPGIALAKGSKGTTLKIYRGPEITGTAYLTGMSQFLFDPEDPVRAGYLLEV